VAASPLEGALQALVVLAVALAALWWVGRMARGRARPSEGLEVAARVRLGPGREVCVIRVGGRGVVVGVGEGGVRPLMTLTEDEMRAWAAPCHGPEAAPRRAEGEALEVARLAGEAGERPR
jgi:flagellar biogenesis protein FliO